MSDEENGVEIVFEEPKKTDKETPEIEITEEEDTKLAKKKEIEPEEGINELKRNLEREKRAREDAERRAKEAYLHAQKASEDKNESDYQLIVNAIDTIKERNEVLKTAYADAMAANDYNRVAEIQDAMTTNVHQLEKLKDGEKAMKKQMKDAENAQPVHPVAPPKGDIVDQLAENVSHRSAEWLRSSREYLKSEREVRKMFRAHEDAVDDGIQPDTDEYFHFIENRLGINREDSSESPLSAASAPAPRKSVAPPAAPVSRGSSNRPNVMRLTRAEADTARDLGMTPEEYAKNKAMLIKENRYNH